jgi:hypothetical protein
MLIATPAAFSGVVQSSLVNCDPFYIRSPGLPL